MDRRWQGETVEIKDNRYHMSTKSIAAGDLEGSLIEDCFDVFQGDVSGGKSGEREEQDVRRFVSRVVAIGGGCQLLGFLAKFCAKQVSVFKEARRIGP